MLRWVLLLMSLVFIGLSAGNCVIVSSIVSAASNSGVILGMEGERNALQQVRPRSGCVLLLLRRHVKCLVTMR